LTGNGRAVALRVLAAVAVFWVAEFALLLAYVLFIRAGHGSIGSGSLTAAGGVIAFAAAAIAAWFVSPRLRRVGVPDEELVRFAAAGPLAASLVAEVATLFAGGPGGRGAGEHRARRGARGAALRASGANGGARGERFSRREQPTGQPTALAAAAMTSARTRTNAPSPIRTLGRIAAPPAPMLAWAGSAGS